jgi:outer membrane autotransporter protein
MRGFSYDPTWMRTLPTKLAGLRGVVATLGLMLFALTSPSHAQAPPLGTAAGFGVLAGSTVTNALTSSSVITGNLGVFPAGGTPPTLTFPDITGFVFSTPSGSVGPGTVTGTPYDAGAVAGVAQGDFWNAYGILAGRPPTAIMTGVDLGGKTLVPGIYFFASDAFLTGTVPLTLNGQGNPNSLFIFNITSALTTGPGSSVLLSNNAQGGNVFWRVGSSATLGTTTSFIGDILASTSIQLDGGDTISCGAAWAHTAAVTLNGTTSTITTCSTPTTASAASVLPSSANNSERAVANAIDTFVANGGTLPAGFANLLSFLSPSQLAEAFAQLRGEAGTGAAQAGTQAMNSFLSLVTNPFENNRGLAPEIPLPPRPMLIYKAPVYKAAAEAAPDPRRWSIWAAAYGGQNNTTGDSWAGSHDRSARAFGYATGLDYRLTPYTVVGFALGGGSTNFGLSDGFGGGHSDMFQAAVYSLTRVNAAYVSAALAYGWYRVSTDRYVTVAGTDHLTADFSANNVGGRIEGGYRFAIPGVFDSSGFGVTPYAAFQMQAFHTPSYSEIAASGSPTFALAYDARTTTATRTELGSWVDKTYALDRNNALSLFGRVAWAHDWYSDPSVTATFQSLPGSSFTEFGAAPVHDSALLSAGTQLSMRNGWSVMAKLDSEFAPRSQTYIGTGQLRYTW